MAYEKKGGGCVPITAKVQKNTQGGMVTDPLLNVGSVATMKEGYSGNSGTLTNMMANPPGSEGSPAPSIVLRGILGLAKYGAKQVGKTGLGKAIKSGISSAITPKVVKEAGKKGMPVIYGSKPLYTKAGKALMTGKKIGNFVLGGKSILGRAASYGAFGLAGVLANKIFNNSNNETDTSPTVDPPKKRDPYADALKNDPNLPSYIKERKGLDKDSNRYKILQNKINKAYGVSKRYKVTEEPVSEISSSKVTTPKVDSPKPSIQPKVVAPDMTPGTNNPNMNLSQKEENTLIRKNKAYDKKQSKIDKARAAGNEKKALRKEKSLRNKKRRNINKASKKQSSKAITPGNNASFDPNEFLM